MTNRMLDPNEIEWCSKLLEENISDMEKILQKSYSVISRMQENHLPLYSQNLIEQFPGEELIKCLHYFKKLRGMLDAACMNVVYASPELMEKDSLRLSD